MQQISMQWFAAVYGADNYGECTYSMTRTCQEQPSTQPLAPTGAPIALYVGIAVGLLALGMILLIRIRRRPTQ